MFDWEGDQVRSRESYTIRGQVPAASKGSFYHDKGYFIAGTPWTGWLYRDSEVLQLQQTPASYSLTLQGTWFCALSSGQHFSPTLDLLF